MAELAADLEEALDVGGQRAGAAARRTAAPGGTGAGAASARSTGATLTGRGSCGAAGVRPGAYLPVAIDAGVAADRSEKNDDEG